MPEAAFSQSTGAEPREDPTVMAQPGIGLAAFDSLHAESEPWLDKCRILPPGFELMAGSRSYLVLGGEGSGKTALFQALRACVEPALNPGEAPDRLVVHWRPRSLPPERVGKAAAEGQLQNVLASCAEAVTTYLGGWPQGFQAAPSDTQATLAWFVCHYLGPEADRRLAAYARHTVTTGASLLCSLPSMVDPDDWLNWAEPNEVIAELIKALRAVGPQAVYILVNPDDLGDTRYLSKDLEAFLSSLALFENPYFVYKIILPEHLTQALKEPMAIDRRRIELRLLKWSPEDLTEIVVARIRLATGRAVDGLGDVCKDDTLVRWLIRTGGDSPRGWLQSAAPLMVCYLRRRRALTVEEWHDIRQDPPPALRFDAEHGTITIGWRRVELTDVPLVLFTHLYENRDRGCSRESLYIEAYLPATEPGKSLKKAKYTPKCDHLLDSAMSRLRKAIEPDPDAPLYILTVRGFGYQLRNVR